MGATATSALATAVVPYGPESKAEGDLNHMMAGAMEALSEAGCLLVGGHTSEGAELALGAPQAANPMQDALIQYDYMVGPSSAHLRGGNGCQGGQMK